MNPQDYEIRYAAAEAGIIAWVDVEGDSALADASVRMVEILTSKGVLTLASPQASAAVPEGWTENDLARACNLARLDYSDFLRIKAYLPLAAIQPEVK